MCLCLALFETIDYLSNKSKITLNATKIVRCFDRTNKLISRGQGDISRSPLEKSPQVLSMVLLEEVEVYFVRHPIAPGRMLCMEMVQMLTMRKTKRYSASPVLNKMSPFVFFSNINNTILNIYS